MYVCAFGFHDCVYYFGLKNSICMCMYVCMYVCCIRAHDFSALGGWKKVYFFRYPGAVVIGNLQLPYRGTKN